MLSVKSISATDTHSLANYYESLASVDDYYEDSQEPPGYWLGTGSNNLGLTGKLSEGQLLKIMQGFHPITGEPIVENAGNDHKPGWDCTYSAPKSVSAIWAIADEDIRTAIESAHKKAVEYSVGYLEREAISTRHGKGGQFKESVLDSGGIVAMGFEHSSSRAQDPQLHTHAIISNLNPEGSSVDLDTYHKMAAGALYRVELASRLREIGFSIQRNGDSFEVEGIPKSLIEKWSTRRVEILKELARTGNDSSKAAEIAALVTRSKKEEISRKELFSKWASEAEEHGVTSGFIQEMIDANAQSKHVGKDMLLSDKEIMDDLIRGSSTVSKLQILHKTAIESQGFMCAEETEKYTLNVMSSEGVVKVSNKKTHLRKDWIKYGDRYTTEEVIKIEKDMLARAERMNLRSNHGVTDVAIRNARKEYSTITEEQNNILESIVSKPSAIAVVQGLAGAGKSYLMGAAREVWELDGYQVIGTAISNQATKNLSKESLIKSFNTAKLSIEIEKGEIVLDSKTIIVVDEAGMQSTYTSANLLKMAEEAGSKIVFVGDTRQLQAIDAGSPMRAIAERIGYSELSEVRRQRDYMSKKIALLFREGRSQEALELLDERDQLHVLRSIEMAQEKLAQAYIHDISKGNSSLCVAATRSEVRDLNQFIRAQLKRDGEISNNGCVVRTSLGYREFSAGDQIIFGERYSFAETDNESTNVWNGATGTVNTIEAKSDNSIIFKVRLSHSGKIVSFNSCDVMKIDHGYASTVHKAQGATVDCCHVLAGERTGREWTYVAGSRHRNAVNFYTSSEFIPELSIKMSRAQQKDMATDYLEEQNQENSEQNIKHIEADRNAGNTKDTGFSM